MSESIPKRSFGKLDRFDDHLVSVGFAIRQCPSIDLGVAQCARPDACGLCSLDDGLRLCVIVQAGAAMVGFVVIVLCPPVREPVEALR
jgi:hypothetical protein